MLTVLAAVGLALFGVVRADMNGMDMTMDGPMDLTMGSMLPYLHFTPGDNLWFLGWVPQSTGAMIGASIGLFLLAIVDRWVAACRSLMEAHWRKQAQIVLANKLNAQRPPLNSSPDSAASSVKGREPTTEVPKLGKSGVGLRTVAPFIPSHDIPRGFMHAGQAVLEFAFMLAVMTFQAGFIISIVIGLGVGETLFGRYNMQAHIY